MTTPHHTTWQPGYLVTVTEGSYRGQLSQDYPVIGWEPGERRFFAVAQGESQRIEDRLEADDRVTGYEDAWCCDCSDGQCGCSGFEPGAAPVVDDDQLLRVTTPTTTNTVTLYDPLNPDGNESNEDECTCWGSNAEGHTDSDCPLNEWNVKS